MGATIHRFRGRHGIGMVKVVDSVVTGPGGESGEPGPSSSPWCIDPHTWLHPASSATSTALSTNWWAIPSFRRSSRTQMP